MPDFAVTRAGAILAVSDFAASLRFYRNQLGLDEVALYDDPPYATLSAAGARISLAEQGHPAPDRPGVAMTAPASPESANVVLVLEVADADMARKVLSGRGSGSWPRRTGRRGAAAGSSAWTRTGTWWRSSSPPELAPRQDRSCLSRLSIPALPAPFRLIKLSWALTPHFPRVSVHDNARC